MAVDSHPVAASWVPQKILPPSNSLNPTMQNIVPIILRGELPRKWHTPRLSDQLNARPSNQQLRRERSSGWMQPPRSSSLARSASPRTALKAGVDVLPHSLFLFLHSVLPGSSSVSRCSHSSEKHFIPAHFGCSRPRSLPSSLRIPASEQRPFSSRRFL